MCGGRRGPRATGRQQDSSQRFRNQDIAAQLKLSVRTVESHISNALRKTGAISRKELTEIARTFHT
ncbi:response regulator transcription factor [Sinomonas terricola]|uniref:response regulator transcription factor n=1 Tax=Sinomonas terricola TaxID=3110330 RepID=UPI003D17C7EC